MPDLQAANLPFAVEPYASGRINGGMNLPTLAQVTALIRQRRSLKPASMDSARSIDRDLLQTLLENATWAPTHGLTQPWRFKIYEGKSRETLAAALQRCYHASTPLEQHREDKFIKLGETPLMAPTVIVCSMHRDAGDKIPEMEEIEAVACALQNLMLSATAAGLGSYWSSPPVLESKEFKRWLGLREQDRCLGLMYVGWARGTNISLTSVRAGLEACVSWA